MAVYKTVDPTNEPNKEGYVGIDPDYQNAATDSYAPVTEGSKKPVTEEVSGSTPPAPAAPVTEEVSGSTPPAPAAPATAPAVPSK